MSGAGVFELLADLLAPPAAGADPEGTPAKAAKAAKTRASACDPADSAPANPLRKSANLARPPAPARADSQGFADHSQTWNRPGTRASACDSQDSQDSQGSTRATIIRDRLLRWGWPADLAAATAARIARRHADDDRRTCPECARYRPGRCLRHRAAGLLAPDVGPELAALPQRCPAFTAKAVAEGAAP